MIDERVYIRQTDLVKPENLKKSILIVGCGSIGSWTGLSLLKLGCQNITMVDSDTIEVHNAGSQLYTSLDANKLKIEAFKDKLPLLVESPEYIKTINSKMKPEDVGEEYEVVIMAVDSITTREQFFRRLRNSKRWFIDGRMAGNIIEVFTVKLDDPASCEAYEKTLFPESEASPVACSSKSVVYNCFIISGMITNIMGRLSSGKTVPNEITVDLENFQMFS